MLLASACWDQVLRLGDQVGHTRLQPRGDRQRGGSFGPTWMGSGLLGDTVVSRDEQHVLRVALAEKIGQKPGRCLQLFAALHI